MHDVGVFHPHHRGSKLISTGLIVAVPEGFYGRVAPRSGLLPFLLAVLPFMVTISSFMVTILPSTRLRLMVITTRSAGAISGRGHANMLWGEAGLAVRNSILVGAGVIDPDY
eukprot:1819759-Rhodomonas_salina.1